MSNSTIKLKSSTTAGNTPSSLETGEFAINVADGNLFYGSASAVKQDLVLETLTVKGSLTAENYIVSSSVTHMTQSFSSGSTIFGDTSDDTHQFTGSLSVTGGLDIDYGDSTFRESVQIGKLDRPITLTGGNSFVSTRPTIEGGGSSFVDFTTGINLTTEKKISFDSDQTNTYIAANSESPEDLEIHADQDIILNPDGQVIANSNISASGTIVGSNLSGTNTGDQDLSSYSTIVQLNASSSALQTNIDGKQATLTFGKSSGNALKSEEALTTNDVLLMGSSNVKGRTYSQFRSDINVEDGADVTDTTNVTAAGALMDSEVTNLAQVKAFDSSDYATAAQGTKADTAIQPSQTSSFSTATGVEDNADVTDTTNVTAAGALMDSELSEIATVKALTATGISGSFTAASASFSTRVAANDAKLTANTTNVTSAGALMDSEVTNLAQVKAFDSSDYATSAQGTKADTAIQPSQTSSFSTATGVEDNADVTDTTNVTAAGALMDSEVTNLAQVKAFDSSDYATAAQGTKADSAIQPADTASFAITGSDVSFGHLSSSHFQVGTLDRPFKITGGGSFAATRPTIEGIGGYINVDSGINLTGEYKLSFDNDVTNTYIKANSDNPEDLEIHADQDIILNPDNAVDIQGILSIPGFNDVSASLAAASGGGGGDITGVTAGNGLTGGGSSGDVTLTVGAGTGVTVNSGDIAIGQAVSTTSNVTFANIVADNIKASGENADALRILDFDGDAFIKFDGKLSANNGVITIGDPDEGGGSTQIKLTDSNKSIQLGINANTHVTASGNISASGTFISNGVTVDATGFGAADNALQVVNSSGTPIFEVEGTGDVTANQSGRVAAFNILRVAAGSQSAPSIAFTSDSNTGIYNPSTDQINIQAGGGTTELYVNTSGVTVNNGTFAIPGFSDVSASLAAAGGGAAATTYRTVIESSCFLAQNTLRYLPFNSLSEQTSFNYLSITPAAADGKLVSITMWPQSSGGSTVVGLHINSNATAATTDTQTITAGTPLTFTFSSNNTFSQNDEISFSVNPTNNINGLAAQIVLEYDL